MAYGTNAPFGLRPICSIDGGSWTEKVNTYYIYTSSDGQTTYTTPIFTGDPVQWGTSSAATLATNGGLGTIARYVPAFTDGTPSTFSAVPVLGVFMGCEYLSNINGTNNLIKSPYWPGGAKVVPGTLIKAFVLDDPSVVYEIQVSTSINAAAAVFVGNPVFPNNNLTGGAPFALAGSFGRNFALNVGGGTNFDTILIGGQPAGYANNPATGSVLTGESAFYLDVDTSTVAGYNNHDYAKNVTTLPLKALGYSLDPRNVPTTGLTMATTPFLNVHVTLNNPVYAIGSLPTVYVA